MFLKSIFLNIIFLCLFYVQLNGQCTCENCPLFIPSNTTQISEINISGAANNTLGTGGQGVCGVSINFFTDAIKEDEMVLIAPNGSSVTLMLNSGVNINQGISFNILFVPCGDVAVPDPGFSAVFDTNAGWVAGASYSGSYYPQLGCLEDLSGPVNGTWTLETTDHIGGDDATLLDWELIFCDPAGINCSLTTCEANGGIIDNTGVIFDLCEGDPDLNFNITTDFGGNVPDPVDYDYTFLVLDDSGVLIDYDMSSDLTSYTAGTYQICGFSYLIDDLALLPNAGSVTETDIQNDIDNGIYCADIGTCFTVNIESPLPTPIITGPTSVCANQIYDWQISNINPDYPYTIILVEGSFNSFNENNGIISISWISGPGRFCVSQQNSCGIEEVCIDITVEAIDENFSILGPSSVCNGAIEDYIISPSLPSGYTAVYSVSFGTILNSSNNGVTIEWLNSSGVVGEVCVDITNGCGSSVQICQLVFIGDNAPLPTFSLPPEVCIGDVINVSSNNSVLFQSYGWTVSNGQITSGQGTSDITLDFTNAVSGIAQVCLDVVTECSNFLTVCENTNVIDISIPIISLVTEGCGPTAELQVLPSTANSFISWQQVNGPSNLVFSDPSGFTTNIGGALGGTYTVEVIEFLGSCSSSSSFTFDLDQPFLIDNIQFDCLDPAGYVVTFTINGGDPPYFADGNALSGNIYESLPVPYGTAYSVNITDSDLCQVVASGDPDCQCVSDAGTMNSDLLEVCEDATISAEWNNNGFLDGNDIGVYILHEGAGNSIINSILESITPDFTFVPGMSYDVVYYISYVVGDDLGGMVDLNDNCLSVSNGQPVIFNQIPNINLQPEFNECGLLTTIEASVDVLDSSEWTQLSGNGNLNFGNSLSLITSVQSNNTGFFEVNLEVANKNCVAEQSTIINFYEQPNESDIIIECQPDGLTYIVGFNIEGGEGPYLVNGSTVSNNVFESSPINSGDSYFFEILDNNDCLSDAISGVWNCNCISSPGSMNTDLLQGCRYIDTLLATYNNDGTLDADDSGIFVLHDSPNNILGNVYEKNLSGSFSFSNNITPNTIYYISYVIGSVDADTVNFNDPCLAVSPGQPIIFYNEPLVDLGTDTMVCGLSMDLSAMVSNYDSLIWKTLDQSSSITITDANNANVTISSNDYISETLLLESWNGTCTSVDTIIVSFNDNPTIIQTEYICTSDKSQFDVEVILSGNGPFLVNNTLTINDTLYFDGINSGDSLSLVAIDANGCSINQSLSENCSCNSVAGSMEMDLLNGCGKNDTLYAVYNNDAILGELDTFVFIVYSDIDDPVGSLISINPSNEIVFNSQMSLNVTYYVSHVTASYSNDTFNLMEVCSVVSNGQPLIFRNPPFINAFYQIYLCTPQAELNINSSGAVTEVVVEPLDPNNEYTFINREIIAQDTGRFNVYIEAEDLFCKTVLDTFVDLLKGPEINLIDVKCIDDSYVVSFEIDYGIPPYKVNDSLIVGNFFTSFPIELDSSYEFIVTENGFCESEPLTGIQTCSCSNDAGTLVFGDYNLCEFEDFSVPENLDYTLTTNDVITYVLYEGFQNNIVNIIQISNSNVIEFDPAYLGKQLLVKRFIGPIDSNGNVDFNAQCVGRTIGIPVMWHPIPIILFEKDFSICESDSIVIPVELIGDFPIELTYFDASRNQVITKIIGETNDSLIILQPVSGTYNVISIESEFCINEVNESFEIEINPLPFAGVVTSDIFVCNNETVNLDLSLNIIGEDEDGLWFDLTNQQLITAEYQVENLNDSINIIYVVENSCGLDTSMLRIEPLLSPDLNVEVVDVLCNGDENGAAYITNENATSIGSMTLNGDFVNLNEWIDNLAPGMYNVIAENNNSCSNNYEFIIFEPDAFEVDLGPDISIKSGESINLIAEISLGLDEIRSINWYYNGDAVFGANDLFLLINEDYDGVISMELENLEGCIIEDSITVNIEYDPIVLPNVFRPGGINDQFFIPNYSQINEVLSFEIFDRWGNKVFNGSSSTNNLSWDGTINGRAGAQGVYIYTIEFKLRNGSISTMSGDITLIR